MSRIESVRNLSPLYYYCILRLRFLDRQLHLKRFVVSDALFIILYVICVMQIMSAIQPDTFFNVSLNPKISELAIIFIKRMVGGIF